MRVALLSGNAPRHNAVGNRIAEMARFFQERGAEVRLFVQDARALHPGLCSCTVHLTEPATDGPAWDYLRQADLIFAVYAQYFDLLQYLPRLAGMMDKTAIIRSVVRRSYDGMPRESYLSEMSATRSQ